MRVRLAKAEGPLVHNVEAWAAELAEATAAMAAAAGTTLAVAAGRWINYG
jgi:hypothetical protein